MDVHPISLKFLCEPTTLGDFGVYLGAVADRRGRATEIGLCSIRVYMKGFTMPIDDAWILLAASPLAAFAALLPHFIRPRRATPPVSLPPNRTRTSHHAPFRPCTLAAARSAVIEHAACPSARCGAKAAAESVLIAAGLGPADRGRRNRFVRR